MQPAAAWGPAGLGVTWQQGDGILWRQEKAEPVRLGTGQFPAVVAGPDMAPVVAWERGGNILITRAP